MMYPCLLENPQPAVPHTQTFGQALEAAAASGSHLWLSHGDHTPTLLTYRELLERAQRAAQQLMDLGLDRGGRVIIMQPTSEAWLVAFFGTLLAGGVAVPVGPTFSFGGLERYAQTIRHIASDARACIFVGNQQVEPYLPILREGNRSLRAFVLAEQLGQSVGSSRPLPSPAGQDLAVLQYTSGTTGLPKGVMLSHRAILSNAFMIGERVGMSSRDVGVSWLPLFHDMGLVGALMTSLHWHYPLLLMPAESFLMHPRRWMQAITQVRASLTVAPNFAYQMAIDRIGDRHWRDLDLHTLRCAFNGSEAVKPSTLRTLAERFGPRGFDSSCVLPVYGMAENSLAATFPARGELWQGLRMDREALETAGRIVPPTEGAPNAETEIVSVGTPLTGVSLAIRDPSGRRLPADAVGEVILRSPSMMDGYWEKPEQTSVVLNDGWLRTGDLGFIHDNRLYLTGRAKEIIIKRGRNYSPDDIEQVAIEVGGSSVLNTAAFSCPNAQAGTEDVVLMLETRALDAQARERIDREINGALIAALGIRADVMLFVAPRSIPRTTSGKIQRAALRARYMQGEIGMVPE